LQLFHIPTNKLKREMSGTGTSVTWVGACPSAPAHVAAVTADGFIKLWHIDDLDQDDADDVIEEGNIIFSLLMPPHRPAGLVV
jgi:hypothetical protein